jgi:hypothetical protein
VKRYVHWFILIISIYVFFEALSYVSLRLIEQKTSTFFPHPSVRPLTEDQTGLIKKMFENQLQYVAHSPSLGWTIKPNAKAVAGLYTTNSQGVRADETFDPIPKSDILRIAAFGDSFTHADDVPNADAWTTRLSQLVPNLEVLNFGVPGYGVDQAFLRYQQDGAVFQPHIVLIGFMSDDIHRHVNVFRPFLLSDTSLPLAKPRYALKDNRLVLLPNPLSRISDYRDILSDDSSSLQKVRVNDYHAALTCHLATVGVLPSIRLTKLIMSLITGGCFSNQIIVNGAYSRDSEAFAITLKLFEMFYEASIANGSVPIILFFPNDGDIQRYWKAGSKQYAPLLDALDLAGYRWIDLMDGFESYRGQNVESLCKGHYTSLGNAVVANYLRLYLHRQEPPGLRCGEPCMRTKSAGQGHAHQLVQPV